MKKTQEEAALGLDPSKYTKEPFHAGKFANTSMHDGLAQLFAKANDSDNPQNIEGEVAPDQSEEARLMIEQILAKKDQAEDLQNAVLTQQAGQPSTEEQAQIKQLMIQRMRGF